MRQIVFSAMTVLSFSITFAGKTSLEVKPGPTQMSAEERAMQPDPEHGVEHAVILIEETDRNEDVGAAGTVQHYHMRAKILSSEGRDLANISIPFSRAQIREWWGKVLLPDGQVLDLPITRIDDQSDLENKGRRLVSSSKAALPGVVPGAVIDYGYEARSSLDFGTPPIPLQRAHPIKHFRYRWEPRSGTYIAAAFTVTNAGKRLPLRAVNEAGAVLLEGDNLPPVVDEPYAPPDWEISGKLLLYYYLDSERDAEAFWKQTGKRFDRSVTTWIRKKSVWEKGLTQIPLPAQADLTTKLQTVYTWLATNVKNTSLKSNEENELAEENDETQRHDPATLLQQREANGYELARLFIGFARYLGAEANLFLAVNRTSQYWLREYMTPTQFGGFLVAVRTDTGPTSKPVIVAPGSGLPWGEVPWYFTGVTGIAVTAQGATALVVPPATADRNRSETKATLTFGSDDQTLRSVWTRRGSGQSGYDERRYLRSLAPEDRDSRLGELCGQSAETEVLKHEAPTLEDMGASFALTCESETSDVAPPEEIGVFHFSWDGNWVERLPDLTAKKRVHPVIFRYPSTDVAEIDIQAPPGFKPGQPLEDTVIDYKYGRYERSVTVHEHGFLIKRTLVLAPIVVNTEGYPDLLGFLQRVRKADAEPVVFVRTRSAAE